MVLRESDKHFLWSLYYAVGVIILWKGIWEGIGGLPILNLPFVDLFIGLVMLTFSGMFLKEFDPLGGMEKSLHNLIHSIHTHPQRNEFVFSYYDNARKKEVKVGASEIKLIEKNMLTYHHHGKERFIPFHRIRRVHRKGKEIWRI